MLLGLAALWSTTPSQASEVFPGALQEAADMQCVPVCLMCHTTNPGTAATWGNKPVGVGVKTAQGPSGGFILKAGDEESLKAAFKVYAATLDAATLGKIRQGIEPSTGQDVCGPTYGCSVPMVPKQPARSRDYTAALWVVSAVTVGGILRRRRKTHAS